MKLPITLVLACILSIGKSQNPGDNIFNENQVLEVDLHFNQIGFWDSLVANYATETYMMADVLITDNTGNYSFDSIGIRLKGNSSYGHPGNKKSFKIDFNRYVSGQEYDGLRKLNFNNCFKDPTFMREKIIYDICKQDSINAPRANYANVYMNDTFWGFYDIVEQVDDEFLETHFNDKSENLFKAGDAFGMGGTSESADLKYYGTNASDYEGKYTLENNTDENDWSDLIALIDFINNTTDDAFASELSAHFNIDQLMKSMALYNQFANLDSYLNSARNYYIYDKDSSGIWEWINWDCNEAFGLYTGGPGTSDLTEMDIYYYAISRPLVERIVTISETKDLYDSYYCELQTNYFNATYITDLINDLYTLIQPYVYADINKMYTNDDFENNIVSDITGSGGPGGGTLYGLESFVTDRTNYIESVLTCKTESVSDIYTHDDLSIYPNPVHDLMYIESNTLQAGALLVFTDALGKIWKKQILNSNTVNTVDLYNLPAGIYFVSIQDEGIFLTEKFVKN